MSDPMHPSDSDLPPELVDELLSADLDGELDAAAADLGLTSEQARTIVDDERHASRRAAFAAVARAGAEGPEPLPDASRAALLAAAAVPADELALRRERRRRRRGLTAIGVAAAALLGAVGLAAVLGDGFSTGGGDDSSTAADVAATTAVASPDAGGSGTGALTGVVDLGDLGDVSDPAAARALLTERIPALSRTLDGSVTGSAPTTFPAPTGEVDELEEGDAASGGADEHASDAARCAPPAAAIDGSVDPGSTFLVATGRGTYRDQPARIDVYTGDRTIVLVFADDNCELLTSLLVP